MDRFQLGLVLSVGILILGIVYLISFDENTNQSPKNAMITNTLKNAQYDELGLVDTHYDRVDSEKKYYLSITDIQPDKGNSIQIVFDPNYFEIDANGNYVKPRSPYTPEFIAVINEGQAFIVGCNPSHLPYVTPTEPIPVKALQVLRYNGITQKDGIPHYEFLHNAVFVPNDIKCKFPEMIQLSLDIDFKLNEHNTSPDQWDHDWN